MRSGWNIMNHDTPLLLNFPMGINRINLYLNIVKRHGTVPIPLGNKNVTTKTKKAMIVHIYCLPQGHFADYVQIITMFPYAD